MTVTSTTPETYGERLRLLRELAGFKSQPDFARASGLSIMTINRAEKMRQEPGKKAREAIVRALRPHVHFDEAWLVYGVGEPPNKEPPKTVTAYLEASGLAVGISAQVRAELLKFPWDALCVANPSTEQIALVRMMIETNLGLRPQ